MRRWLQLPIPLLLMLAIGVVTRDGQLARTAPRRDAKTPSAPVTASPAVFPAPGALSPRNANYQIEARLDPDQRTITGREWLTWRNITGASTSELRSHLYYNAFQNTRSTWLRERASAGRLGRPLGTLAEKDWGWTNVTAIRLVGVDAAPPIDLTSRRRFDAPDAGNKDDETVMVVPLPRPVAPGETVNIYLEWTAQVPRTFARTGAIGNTFFLGQWFPKVGVLQENGWNCHQFHAGTEFFSAYGVYDVSLTVPADWKVGATGVIRDSRKNDDGTALHRYYQEDVHDFAWTTSPDYIELRAEFRHPTLPRVEMR